MIEKNRIYYAKAVQFKVIETYAKDESQGPRQTVVQGLRRGKCVIGSARALSQVTAPHYLM